jgi:3-amino-5-hydroxybenzoic acid synthesis related protein
MAVPARSRLGPEGTRPESNSTAVVFDLDGVLVDSIATTRLAFERAYAAVVGPGVAPFDEYLRHLGRRMPESLRLMGLPDAMYPAFRRESSALVAGLRAYPGIQAVVRRLRADGVRLAVATGRPRARAEQVTRVAGLRGDFHAVVGSDEVANGKPAPDIVLLALDRLGVSAAEAVVVGDSPLDLRAARAAGARAVGACWGQSSRDELLAERPDAVADRVTDLGAVLGAVLGAGR